MTESPAVTLEDDSLDPELAAALQRERDRPWPGPDLYTLRGIIELELAIDTDVTVDAAHAVLSDGAVRAFGPRWYQWVTEALTAEGRDPEDLSVILTDDSLAERVLEQVREGMREDDEAPDPPDMEFGWYAYGTDDPSGARERFRRATRRRTANARMALLAQARRRVAGRRKER